MAAILEGIRVLDFSRFIAGPICCAMLADMGAEVVRVDGPEGEEDRNIGPVTANGQHIWFQHWGRHKRGITLELGKEQGQSLALDLVRCSDVAVHNFAPGTPPAVALAYERLRQANPSIIVAAVSAYGQTGPWANQVGFDAIIQALSGVMSLTGLAGGPPMRTGVTWVDYSTGYNAALGVVGALFHRARTGQGQMVDVSLLDVAVYPVIASGIVSEHRLLKRPRRRIGNQSWYSYINMFQCQDGYVVISPGIEGQWRRLARMVGGEELAKDPRYRTYLDRFENREALDPIVQAWTGQRTVGAVMELLQKARVPCAPVLTIEEMAEHPQVRARGMLVELGHPGEQPVTVAGLPIKFSSTPAVVEGPAPRVGEHNAAVYGELLGLEGAALQGLRREGVL